SDASLHDRANAQPAEGRQGRQATARLDHRQRPRSIQPAALMPILPTLSGAQVVALPARRAAPRSDARPLGTLHALHARARARAGGVVMTISVNGQPAESALQSQTARDVLLDVRNVKKYFPIHRGLLRKVVGHVRAVEDVSFQIHEGETLGLVGESGCGKTTTGRLVLRATAPTSGQIKFRYQNDLVDLTPLSRRQLKPIRPDM